MNKKQKTADNKINNMKSIVTLGSYLTRATLITALQNSRH
jgi:hypothetical protein